MVDLVAYEQLPDEALVEACGRGELRAFEHLLQRHRRPVYNYMYWQVGNGAQVDDLLQEVFLRVLGETGTRAPASFTTHLYAIVRDLCLREIRRGAGPPRSMKEWEDGVRKVLVAIDDLEDEQREVFFLREYLDLSFKQIAEIVGCEKELVKERMRSALNHLRQEVA